MADTCVLCCNECLNGKIKGSGNGMVKSYSPDLFWIDLDCACAIRNVRNLTIQEFVGGDVRCRNPKAFGHMSAEKSIAGEVGHAQQRAPWHHRCSIEKRETHDMGT